MSPRPGTSALLLLSALLVAPAGIQSQGTLEDYRRAATIQQRYAGLTVGLVQGGVRWISDTHATYRVSVPGGNRHVLVDAAAWRKAPAFDHERLAPALSAAADTQYSAITLPFAAFEYVDGRRAIEFEARGSRFRCAIVDYSCERTGAAVPVQGAGPGRGGGAGGGRGAGAGGGAAAGAGRGGAGAGAPGGSPAVRASPDGTAEAFIENFNVGIRAVGNGGSTRMLSTDGIEGDAYELNSIRWSPDSRRFVAYRRKPGTTRHVYIVRSSPADQLQPKLDTVRNYTKPGDTLAVNQPALFEVATGRQVMIDRALFPNPYQISAPVWRDNGRSYTFEYNQRGHQVYRVLEVNAETGNVRAVISEEPETFFSYRNVGGLNDTGHRYRFDVDDGREIIWMSQRDNWAHLYLYDGATGRVKNQITKGDWTVQFIDSVDVRRRQIYFRAGGMNPDQDPYFTHHYRINFDGTGLVKYTEANGTHALNWSPDRRWYIDTYSRVDMPTVVELRRASDRRMLPLERGDMTAAVAAGFRPPEVFVARGRDGVTDIWGIIVRPFTFDSTRKYPVREAIYAGPQGSFVPKGWGGGQNHIATAEIGFIMVQIDGMGTNNRSKAFHDVAWQNLGDAGFPDRILWHEAAAAKYPWYDATRVGLHGSSAGGQNAAGGVIFHGDFYKAAFASSGCHDNRMDKIWWNEQWMGWPIAGHYEASSNVVNAHRLRGKLFLAVGEMDSNVDPASTMQLVNALVAARKTFDLLVVPNGGHGATGPAGSRTMNDFFVKSLIGIDPPDWNSGLSIALGESMEQGPAWGFFESAADDSPPYTWW